MRPAFGPGERSATHGTTTNLAAALKLAVKEFGGPGRRPNAPKVIFIMPSFYNPDGVDSPVNIAEEFKESGGIIVVWYSLERTVISPQ